MSRLKALDLFEGGETGVKERMAKNIKDGLQGKIKQIKTALNVADDNQVIEAIAEKLGINSAILTKILYSKLNGEVNYKLFSRLEIPLKLSIHRALGRPTELDNLKIKKKWEKELEGHPMLRAAAILTHDREDESNVTPNELELYVILRAIGEL